MKVDKIEQMKRIILSFVFSILLVVLYGQTENSELKMISKYAENEELSDILWFEEIDYFKIKFVGGEELKNKSYCIRVKEFKDGILTMDTIAIDTKKMGIERFETINDTILSLNVIAKQTLDNKLKIMFKFPAFVATREYETIITEDNYSLRNLADESKLPIKYNESFYLLAYILPYHMGNGYKSYCEVGQNGKDVENWGTKFGIKHYLLFEMKIE